MAAIFDAAFRHWLRMSFILSSSATAGVVVSIAADALLTAARLAAQRPLFLVLPSLAVEVALAGFLIVAIRQTTRRSETISALLPSRAGRGET
jgi:hypothetical protein